MLHTLSERKDPDVMENTVKTKHSVGTADIIIWSAAFLLLVGATVLLDSLVWQKIDIWGPWLNVTVTAIVGAVFIYVLLKFTDFKIGPHLHITLWQVIFSLLVAFFFFAILSRVLMPVADSLFPASQKASRDILKNSLRSPVAAFLYTCIISPLVQNIFIRGFLFGSLKERYSFIVALLISSLPFALISPNLIQILLSFIVGAVLCYEYNRTGSLTACILTQSFYNLAMFVAAFVI